MGGKPQAALSMGFLRQKYWSGLLFPFEGDLPNPGIEPMSTALVEKAMATHSSVLAWRIPETGEPDGLRLWGRTESDTTEVT